ncbi:MAG: Ig-like domain-containing protein, partial [Bacteroidaceae bacterium]|nr:Ig-like domain-containing protein [Bacteroidaceae bacterium]
MNSTVGNHTGALINGASLTGITELPILSLGPNNGYFDMGASVGEIIATLNDFTISTNVYIPSTTTLGSNGNFIYTFANSTNIGGDANGCIFFGANETRYTICRTNYQAEQNVIANYRFPTGSWHTLTYRQSNSVGELFLDGEIVATGAIPINPTSLGQTQYNFLGRSCYQGDTFLKDACYNDFRVYDNAVDDATITSLTLNINSLNNHLYQTQINALIDKIELEGATFYEDIPLPTSNENGITVTWASSDESIVSSAGSVTRPAYGNSTARVTLTATFKKGDVNKQKSFTVNIPAHEIDDKSLVEADIANLSINGHLNNLATNLYLPTKGHKGSNIKWTSSHPDILNEKGELLSQDPKKRTQVTLTATAYVREAEASRTFDITIAKKPPFAYYLFAYFNGNAQWQEQTCFALSTDGYNYTPLNNGNPIISSDIIANKQAVRDPHILRGEDGYFYMVVTDMRSDQGWSSNDGMVLLRSADMVNWTHTAIDFPTRWPHRFDRNALTQVWAPQTIYDPEEGKYMVYYAIGESDKNYITYYSYANEDFTDLTEPQVLYDHNGMNTIDADIVWHDGKYHMFFKTEGQGNGIQKATAKTLRGEWTPEYQYLQQTSAAVEGSGVFKKIDSDEWVLMYDCYTNGRYEYCTSTDLSNFTWVCNSTNTNIFTPRHGTTIAITAEEAERLTKAWPSDGLDIIDWVDITDYFVESPRFDNNSSAGWTVISNAHSQAQNFQTMEFWNGTFNIYQTIEVPNGKYRLSVQSFYNPAADDMGYLYANEVTHPIVARNSEGVSSNTNPGTWNRVFINGTRSYIPNNMEAGNYCFEQGLYNNSLEVEVTDGSLTFGLICEETNGANWCMFDNFKLESLGHMEIITMEEIKLPHSVLNMTEGDNLTLCATILPENAVNKEIVWSSTHPEVATVDKYGTIRALKGGETTITAEAADGSGIEATCKIHVTALEDTWLDVTEAYITNPQFENNSNQGWNIIANAGSQQLSGGSMEFWNGTFNIFQTINVPNGRYRLSAQAYYRTSSNDQGYNAFVKGTADITTYLYANQSTQPIANIYSESLPNATEGRYYTPDYIQFFPDDMAAGSYCFTQGLYHNSVITEVTDGTLTIGLINENYAANNWCMFDNFQLEYYGDYVPVESITLSQTELTLSAGESCKLVATIQPDNATIKGIIWSSDNPMVANVDKNGVITAYQGGTTIIHATSKDEGGLSASIQVAVQSTTISTGDIIINEIQSSNIDMFVDPSFNYGAWIELYNSTDESVNINYLYISDDAENLTKYNLGIRGIIPAKGYRVLWFDHYNFHYAPSQIDTKLDFDGGTIYISDPDGTLITSQDYPVAIPRTSYARITDGAEEWGFTAEPTPGKSNSNSTFAEERLEAPIIDKDACLFTNPFTFNVEKPEGTTLRYTTDGTTPTLTNGQTSEDGAFYVDYTTIYRFRLFEEGKLPSQVVTRSFIYKDNDYMLPIISVVTDPINLYDDSLGVYVRGVNGRTGNGQQTPCNWNMDWDRPVNFEYITPEEGMV